MRSRRSARSRRALAWLLAFSFSGCSLFSSAPGPEDDRLAELYRTLEKSKALALRGKSDLAEDPAALKKAETAYANVRTEGAAYVKTFAHWVREGIAVQPTPDPEKPTLTERDQLTVQGDRLAVTVEKLGTAVGVTASGDDAVSIALALGKMAGELYKQWKEGQLNDRKVLADEILKVQWPSWSDLKA